MVSAYVFFIIYTHIYIYIYIYLHWYIYIYIYIYFCVYADIQEYIYICVLHMIACNVRKSLHKYTLTAEWKIFTLFDVYIYVSQRPSPEPILNQPRNLSLEPSSSNCFHLRVPDMGFLTRRGMTWQVLRVPKSNSEVPDSQRGSRLVGAWLGHDNLPGF